MEIRETTSAGPPLALASSHPAAESPVAAEIRRRIPWTFARSASFPRRLPVRGRPARLDRPFAPGGTALPQSSFHAQSGPAGRAPAGVAAEVRRRLPWTFARSASLPRRLRERARPLLPKRNSGLPAQRLHVSWSSLPTPTGSFPIPAGSFTILACGFHIPAGSSHTRAGSSHTQVRSFHIGAGSFNMTAAICHAAVMQSPCWRVDFLCSRTHSLPSGWHFLLFWPPYSTPQRSTPALPHPQPIQFRLPEHQTQPLKEETYG